MMTFHLLLKGILETPHDCFKTKFLFKITDLLFGFCTVVSFVYVDFNIKTFKKYIIIGNFENNEISKRSERCSF